MANVFAVVPNIIPGALSVGGNLSVNGDVIVGTASPKARLFSRANTYGALSWNLGSDFATRDDGAKPAQSIALGSQANTPQELRLNSAGSVMTDALLEVVATDYTAHAHTGTTTEDTIYSKVISAGLLGNNGALRVRLAMTSSVQNAPFTFVRVKLGGTNLAQFGFNAALPFLFESHTYNTNSASAQITDSLMLPNGVAPTITTAGATAINTAVDQTLTVTIQNGTAADAQQFQMIYAQLLNSFGPV